MNSSDKELRDMLNPGEIPDIVNEKLIEAYSQIAIPKVHAAPRKKLWRSLVIAAALCGALTATSLAAGGQIWTMLQGAVGFFDNKSNSQPAPVTLESIQSKFEAMNASVNLSATDKDIVFTVENISIDDNFINIFGSASMQGLRENLMAKDIASWEEGKMPEYWALRFANISPVAKINGKVYGINNELDDATNLYFVDENTIKFARRMLVDDVLPDTFTIDVMPSYGLAEGKESQSLFDAKEGNWTITTEIDITNTRGAVKKLSPSILELGDKKLDLIKFSKSPLGTIAVVDEHFGEYTVTNNEGEAIKALGPIDNFTSLYEYAMRDDKGNWVYIMRRAAYGGNQAAMHELVNIADDAQSLTFIPITTDEKGFVTSKKTAPLVVGSKIPLNSICGYTIESFSAKDQHFEINLVPYGPMSNNMEILPLDAQGQPFSSPNSKTGIASTTNDHLNGNVKYTLDYYETVPNLSEAAQIEYYPVPEIALDEANAVTVPFS